MLLSTNFHKHLTENVLNLLRKKDIHSVLDFLKVENKLIEKYTSLTYPEIIEVKKFLSKTYSAPPINAFAYYQKILANSALYSTGIPELDTLLQGGLFTRTIYEFCGAADSDKLHVILLILQSFVCNGNNKVYFLDPKRDFSAKYMKDKLSKIKGQEESLNLLPNILVKHICDKYQLIAALFDIKREVEEGSKVRIIITHSISSLFLTTNDHTERNNILNHLANILRYLAVEHNMLIIVTNLITSWIEGDFQVPNETKEKIACGKYWQSTPNVRIKIKKASNSFEFSLLKYNNVYKEKKCDVALSF